MNILGIETSCDETAAAVISDRNGFVEILSNVVSSQVNLHAQFGGVVPNLAAREHVKNTIPVLEEALSLSGLVRKDIDLISVTAGPGLIPALLVGVNAATSLSYAWQKPLIPIHHIEGHIYANFVGKFAIDDLRLTNESNEKNKSKNENPLRPRSEASQKSKIHFPVLCLVVSGGHTQLVFMKDHLQYEIIGQTLDDAAGEAFDKVARILNLGYPGGPAVSAAAEKFTIDDLRLTNEPSEKNKSQIENRKSKITLPRPMLNSNDFNFSFSGLKTAVLYETKKNPELLNDENYINELAHEFQQAALDVLIQKTIQAAKKYNPKTIMLAGGVSANKELREQLGKAIGLYRSDRSYPSYHILDAKLSGDNAAMIATAAYFRWQKMNDTEKQSAKENWRKVEADANLKIQSL